jgi:hypothetical protein
MIDDETGAVCGMRIGTGNRRTLRKPTPVPLCPPQIPHDLTWARSRAPAVGSSLLTAWAMVRPTTVITMINFKNVTPYSLVELYRRFGRACCIRLQDRSISHISNHLDESRALKMEAVRSCKKRSAFTRIYGVTSLRIMPFIKPKHTDDCSYLCYVISVQNLLLKSLWCSLRACKCLQIPRCYLWTV